jgi:hypothetical protein
MEMRDDTTTLFLDRTRFAKSDVGQITCISVKDRDLVCRQRLGDLISAHQCPGSRRPVPRQVTKALGVPLPVQFPFDNGRDQQAHKEVSIPPEDIHLPAAPPVLVRPTVLAVPGTPARRYPRLLQDAAGLWGGVGANIRLGLAGRREGRMKRERQRQRSTRGR